jgi:hypothetical protein
LNTQKEIKLLSEEYMDEHADDLNWDEVSLYQKMIVDFIVKHQKQINFRLLSGNPFLTFEIIDRFSTKISWPTISMNGKGLSESMMFNYRNKLVWSIVLSQKQLELKFLIIMSEIFRKSRAKNAKEFWKAVSKFQPLDKTYIDNYKRYVDFTELSKNPYLKEDLMEVYYDKLDKAELFKKHDLSKDFLTKHRKDFMNAIK